VLARDLELVADRQQPDRARVAVAVQRVAEARQRAARLAVLAPDASPSESIVAAYSVAPRITEPQPSRPAATAPCSDSGAADSVIRAACTLGTSPCSAIETRHASVMRRSRTSGARPIRSRKNSSVSVT
jgi:hypothetical protein